MERRLQLQTKIKNNTATDSNAIAGHVKTLIPFKVTGKHLEAVLQCDLVNQYATGVKSGNSVTYGAAGEPVTGIVATSGTASGSRQSVRQTLPSDSKIISLQTKLHKVLSDKKRESSIFQTRKLSVMKKAQDLSTLTGTQVMVLVASESGQIYTFATKKLRAMFSSDVGKSLVRTCLNAPDVDGADNSNEPSYATFHLRDADVVEPKSSVHKYSVLHRKLQIIPNCIPKQEPRQTTGVYALNAYKTGSLGNYSQLSPNTGRILNRNGQAIPTQATVTSGEVNSSNIFCSCNSCMNNRYINRNAQANAAIQLAPQLSPVGALNANSFVGMTSGVNNSNLMSGYVPTLLANGTFVYPWHPALANSFPMQAPSVENASSTVAYQELLTNPASIHDGFAGAATVESYFQHYGPTSGIFQPLLPQPLPVQMNSETNNLTATRGMLNSPIDDPFRLVMNENSG